jgi:hypothetical protein
MRINMANNGGKLMNYGLGAVGCGLRVHRGIT